MSYDEVNVTVVGTGTGRELKDDTLAMTPGSQPNIAISVIGPVRALAIRFTHQFLLSLTTGGGAEYVGIIPDGYLLEIALAAAVGGLLKDLVTIFNNLESKYPGLTGSV